MGKAIWNASRVQTKQQQKHKNKQEQKKQKLTEWKIPECRIESIDDNKTTQSTTESVRAEDEDEGK